MAGTFPFLQLLPTVRCFNLLVVLYCVYCIVFGHSMVGDTIRKRNGSVPPCSDAFWPSLLLML